MMGFAKKFCHEGTATLVQFHKSFSEAHIWALTALLHTLEGASGGMMPALRYVVLNVAVVL